MRQINSKNILIEKCVEPSEIIKKRNGIIVKHWVNQLYKTHSIFGQPALIYYLNGEIIEKQWYKNGKFIKSS
jgi:hypothetical protein